MATKLFKGVIKLDVRDSVPDWEPYTPTKAPEGAPNILFVLYIDSLAKDGMRCRNMNMETQCTATASARRIRASAG